MSSPPTSATILLVGNPGEQHRLSLAARFCAETIDGPHALERARESHPDLIVAPLGSSDVDGVSLCEAVRQDPVLSGTPVALIAEEGRESANVLRAFAAGADECVDASLESEVLVARIAALIARRANEREAAARFHELELRASHLEAELRAVHKNAHQVEAIGRLRLCKEADELAAMRATVVPTREAHVGAMAHTLQNAQTLAHLTGNLCDASDHEGLVEQLVAFAVGGLRAAAPARTARARTRRIRA